MRNYYFNISVVNITKTIILAFFIILPLTLSAQQVESIRSGVTFQWADTQSTPSDPATIESVTIDGNIYNTFVVPSSYELTKLGWAGDEPNIIMDDGVEVASSSADLEWNTKALSAFQDKDLNHYFSANPNGRDICLDFDAIATTDAQTQSIFYNPAIPANEDGVIAITERNANNCFYIAIYGTPANANGGNEILLGQTFIRNYNQPQAGPTFAAPTSETDYWRTGRVNQNDGTIGMALFYLSDIVPLGSKITRIAFTAATEDHGDGKFFLMQKYAVDQQTINCIDAPYKLGNLSILNNAPEGSTYSLIDEPDVEGQRFLLLPDGRYGYQPPQGFTGEVNFTYQLCLPTPNEEVCDIGAVKLIFVPLPSTPKFTTSCANDQFTVTVTEPLGSEFMYSLDGSNYQENPIFENQTAGTYTLSVMSNASGCENSDVDNPVVLENEAPTGSAPEGLTNVNTCLSNAQATVPFSPSIIAENYTDDCSDELIVTLTDSNIVGDDCSWILTYTYNVEDQSGMALTGQIITHTGGDKTAPVIDETNVANLEVECGTGDAQGMLDTWLTNHAGATATDNCNTINWSNNYVAGTMMQCDNSPIEVIFTATDSCGNSDSFTATYLIKDTTAPVIETEVNSLNVSLDCDNETEIAAALALEPTATDDCTTPAINLVSDETTVNPDCPNAYVRVRTWNFIDSCNNTSENFVQTITVVDNTLPVLTVPNNITVECSGDVDPSEAGQATAIDNCDENPVITFSDEREDGACEGSFTITRTWTATDACGNAVSDVQIITSSDTTSPEFDQTDLPEDLTVECGNVPEEETLTATDNCGEASVSVNDVRSDGNCDFNYIITRTYTATDACGLTKTHLQTITVQDTTAPTFDGDLPEENIIVECDEIPAVQELTATDSCGTAVVTSEDVRVDGDCDGDYTIMRTWTATDECGNDAVYTQNITVQDTKAPVFEGDLPTDITVECDAIPNAEDLTATDNCGTATVTVTDVRTNGDCPSNYVIARTWTASDGCNLSTSHTQLINVTDTTAPVPVSTFETELEVSCTEIPEVQTIEFEDNCSSNITVVFEETSTFEDGVLEDYVITRSWSVSDECSNDAIYTQTINVRLDELFAETSAPDRCYDDGVINLNDFLDDSLNTDGTWEMIEGNDTATLEGSIFDPTVLELSEDFLPNDGGIDYLFRYTTTDMGCSSVTELSMNINADCKVLPCGENDIEISKAVTPNGDGINEVFYISGIKLCGFVADVKIFNRWGALVFEGNAYPLVDAVDIEASITPANSWDGSAQSSFGNADNLPSGTYYYIINLRNSGLTPITGPVYLATK